MTFVLLCLTYFTQCDTLSVHPYCYKWHYFILFNSWVIFHCILLSCVWLFVTPWTIAHQAPLSVGGPVKRQQYEHRLEWWWLGAGWQFWRWQSEPPGILLGELTRLVDGRSARYEGREKLVMNWDEKISFTEKWRTCQFWTCYVIFGQLLTCLDIFPHL